jgi:hypothetical protein
MSWKIFKKSSKKELTTIDASVCETPIIENIFEIKVKKISKVTIKTKNNE